MFLLPRLYYFLISPGSSRLAVAFKSEEGQDKQKKKLLNDVQLPFPCYIFMLVVQPAPRNSRTQLHRLELLFLNVTVITLAEAC